MSDNYLLLSWRIETMGVFSDLLLNAKSIDITAPITALDKVVIREFKDMVVQGDFVLPTEAAAGDEVQSLATSTQTSGNMTLTFTLANGETFTTASIAFDAAAATVETAVDVAASLATDEVQSIAVHVATISDGTFTLTFTTAAGQFTTAAIAYDAAAATIETAVDVAATAAAITGWTNGDITVAGTDLTATPITFTYDGTSVAGVNQGQVTIDGTNLIGNGSAGAVSTTTQGKAAIVGWTNGDISVSGGALNVGATVFTFDGDSVKEQNMAPTVLTDVDGAGGAWGAVTTTTVGSANRLGWGALVAYSLAVVGDIPAAGVTPTAFTSPRTPGHANYPSDATIRALAREAAIEDSNAATEAVILAAANLV